MNKRDPILFYSPAPKDNLEPSQQYVFFLRVLDRGGVQFTMYQILYILLNIFTGIIFLMYCSINIKCADNF